VENRITEAPFGTLPRGEQVKLYTLTNTNGLVAKITNFGGIITELHVPDRDGNFADVVLGFDSLEPYRTNNPYFGALIGRYGNRIARGRFILDGHPVQLTINDGRNHLHGGAAGFDKVLWGADVIDNALELCYHSPHGEQGYPGTVDVLVTYTLTDDNELVVSFRAATDKATPVNLTQHSYFNLAGGGDILGHMLTLEASAFVPIDSESIPTGVLAPLAGTPFDFRQPQAIGSRIGLADEQLFNGKGYDHCFVLDKSAPGTLVRAGRVHEPRSGRVLEVFTEEPGVQFYSGNLLDGTLSGKGKTYARRSGFCLEPQHFPDSPNHPTFPDTILRPGEVYETESRFRFSIDQAGVAT
jgi:aldose 1-epimerase